MPTFELELLAAECRARCALEAAVHDLALDCQRFAWRLFERLWAHSCMRLRRQVAALECQQQRIACIRLEARQAPASLTLH